MKGLRLLMFAICSLNAVAKADEYKTPFFNEDNETTGMFICLYLAYEFSYVNDAEQLYNGITDHFSLSKDMKKSIMEDAKIFWSKNLLNFDEPADKVQDRYWATNCEEPTQNMRDFFRNKEVD